MATLTSRLKLRKPDSTDVVNVATDLNASMDAIDTAIGYQVCTSGTRPGTPYQGQTIFETDTGYNYMWSGTAWTRVLTEISPLTSQYGFRNRVINGDMSICQRGPGTAFSCPANTVTKTLDMWTCIPGTGATTTLTHQAFALGGQNDRQRYRLSWNRTVAGTVNSLIQQPIEGVDTLAGKTVTVSWMASTASGSVDLYTRLDQYFGTGGSPSTAVSTGGPAPTVTTTPTLFSYTITLPSVSGKTLGTNGNDAVLVVFGRLWNATNGATGEVRIWDVQVEESPVATPFEWRPQQVELAMCQRYYWRITDSVGSNAPISSGMIVSATQAYAVVPLPVTFRVVPTSSNVSAPGSFVMANSANFAASAISMTNATVNMARLLLTIAGATANTPGELRFNSVAGAWIEFSAEL